MPKKKLTKAQVKKKMQNIVIVLYDLFTDKMAYSDSSVPMSENKILDLYKPVKLALQRIK